MGFLTDKEPHLYLFDVATKKLSKLTNGPVDGAGSYGEEGGAWSPDGTKVAFMSNQSKPDPDRTANPDVFVVEARAGATPKQLTTFAGTDSGPLVWTRDSKEIVYRQGTAPHYSIYDLRQMAMVPAAGGEVKTAGAEVGRVGGCSGAGAGWTCGADGGAAGSRRVGG